MGKMSIITLSVILLFYTVAMVVFFMKQQKLQSYKKGVLFKGAASLGFLLTALVMLPASADGRYAGLVTIGLALGLAGDELLALRFIYKKHFMLFFVAGAAAFAAGHIFYLCAMIGKYGFPMLSIFFELIGLAGAVLYVFKAKTDAGSLMIPGGGYIALVTFMGAVAVACATKELSAAATLFALGGIGFTISDNLLCGLCFGEENSFSIDVWVHITYYLAQLCIAWSILLVK